MLHTHPRCLDMIPNSRTAHQAARVPTTRHTQHALTRKHQHTTNSCSRPAVMVTTTTMVTTVLAPRPQAPAGELQPLPAAIPPLRHRKCLKLIIFRQPAETKKIRTSNTRERFYCDVPNCYNSQGEPSSASRRADLNRHYQSVHGSVLRSCPWPRCERRDDRGFPRLDHLIEHRRGFHHEAIPKRETVKESWG
jgi:hypothetical protein